MKGFYIEITNRLLEPKHRKAMKESVWLFMWLLDRITSINEDGVGKVLKGHPVKYEDIKTDLDIPERTYSRWCGWLKRGGYINKIRTPYGLVFTVNKAKKRFGQRTDTPKMAYPDTPKMVRDTPKRVERYAKLAETNLTRQRQDKDRDFSFEKSGMKKIDHLEFLKKFKNVSAK